MKRRKANALIIFAFKALVAIFFIGAIAAGAAGVFYYIKFNRLFEARLKNQPPEKTAVYGRPFRVYEGQKLSFQTFQDRLERIGYLELGVSIFVPKPGLNWYQAEGGKRVRLSHPDEHGVQQSYEILFAGSRITSIVHNGEEVPEGYLRPEYLSNLFGPARVKKRYLRFEEIPPNLVHAVLAAEDDGFFEHLGLDVVAIVRAAVVNLTNQDQLQGASTLTQQFIKNYFLTPERSVKRKLEEVYMALLLEKRLSKKEIFELYANEVYLGQAGSFSILGFGEGARVYFGKNVNDLTLAEAAFLAGIIQAPNRYAPYHNGDAALARRNHILDLMEEKKFITTRENALSRSAALGVVPRGRHSYADAPYFVDHVREALDQNWPDWGKDLKSFELYTTLDADLQRAVVEAVSKGIAEIDKRLGRRRRPLKPQVAMVVMDPRTGEILAMAGGRSYGASQYNRTTRALRQPGSTFKPFVYAAALEKGGYTLSSSFVDEPYTFYFGDTVYSPSNYEDRYHGRVTLRKALALSLNVATVKLAQEIGFDQVAGVSNRLGFSHPVKAYPSAALGTFEVTLLELAQAYTAFANEGNVVPASGVRALKKNGVLYEQPRPAPVRVLRPDTAFLVTSALQSVVNEGTGGGVRARGFRLPAAGKTGSSDDSWFVGYTPDLLAAVWVGLDEHKPVHLSGSQAALPIWTHFALAAQRMGYLSGQDFRIPSNIVAASIDPRTGLLAWETCDQVRTEYYIRGTEPVLYCTYEYEYEMIAEAGESGMPANGEGEVGTGADPSNPDLSSEEKRQTFWRRFWRVFR